MIDISEKEIVQICATIIAGGLIFLTLASFSATGLDRDKTAVSVVFGMAIIVIFSIAARFATAGKKATALNIFNYGLGFLIGIAIAIAGLYFLTYAGLV